MGLRKNIGKAALRGIGGAGNRMANSPVVTAGIIGTAAVAGGLSALKSDPWGDPMSKARLSMKAEVISRVTGTQPLEGLNSTYYGRPVQPQRRGSGPAVVPGEIVFGMQNSRRGRVR